LHESHRDPRTPRHGASIGPRLESPGLAEDNEDGARERGSIPLGRPDPVALDIRDEAGLTSRERDSLGCRPTLDNFAHYARHSTDRTRLFFVKVYRGEDFLGLAPITKLVRHQCTDLLRPDKRRWLGPILAPLSRQTTYMIDSAFLAFEYASPFFCPAPEDEAAVRTAVSDHLKQKPDVDTVWIAEPRRNTSWARAHHYDCFSTLPMVHVDLTGHATVESYLAALSKKRRRNWRVDREAFDAGGGTLAYYTPPVPQAFLEDMHGCLLKSAARGELAVPYSDVLNDRAAFHGQPQHALVARVGGRIVGFFSCIRNGPALQQCHGGFDYDGSHTVKAYANLINAAIEHAITNGLQRVTMGPLNNETKRRAGTDLMPVMVSIWCRDAMTRLFMRSFFLKNLQVYTGPG
jgi:hypothetical protein